MSFPTTSYNMQYSLFKYQPRGEKLKHSKIQHWFNHTYVSNLIHMSYMIKDSNSQLFGTENGKTMNLLICHNLKIINELLWKISPERSGNFLSYYCNITWKGDKVIQGHPFRREEIYHLIHRETRVNNIGPDIWSCRNHPISPSCWNPNNWSASLFPSFHE